jgi:hypothetical protein
LAGLEEVYVKNRAENWLTTRTSMAQGGIAAAASEAVLPSDATGDFSEVTLINQVGRRDSSSVLSKYSIDAVL